MIQKGNTTLLHGFPEDYFAVDADRSKCLHVTSSNALFCTHYIGNVICHKVSHDDFSYRFNGENLKAMLELSIFTGWAKLLGKYSVFCAVVWRFIFITLLRSPLLAFSSALLHMTVSSLTTRRMPGFTLTWPGMSRGLSSSTLRATSRLWTSTRGNSRKYSRLLPRMQMG